jgi:hypothetical protein
MNETLILPLFLVLAAFIVFRLLSRSKIGKASKTGDARLKRIANASFVFRLLIYTVLLVVVYQLLAYYFGWPGHERFTFRPAPGHEFTSPADMPPEVEALWLVQAGLGFWAMVVLSRLFQLYEQGIFFAAKNVNCIRFLGYYLIINWVVRSQLQGALHDPIELTSTGLFNGFLIIFIAWIMDEGRKIQEEQELTV